MSKKLYLLGMLPLIFLLSSCSKDKDDHEQFGPSPGDGKSRVEEPGESFGPSLIDGR